MNTFDPTKPVQTREGRKARIICADFVHPIYSIIALIKDNDNINKERPSYYLSNGQIDPFRKYPSDLINVPEEQWVIGLKKSNHLFYSFIFSSKEQAEDYVKRETVTSRPFDDFIFCKLST